jgi:hypothetical protein
MLTRDELIELFSEANRKLFLGNDLYERCVRNGRRITREELERRLNFWRDNRDFSNMFRNCNVDDVSRICNFSPNQPVNDIEDNICYNDVHNGIRDRRKEIIDVNECPICDVYNNAGELPNKLGCGHYFHYSCINKWVETGKNNTCPSCRQPINMLVGFPTENNRQLFERIQLINRNFATTYMREMRMFMRPDEIKAFKAIFKNIQFEEEDKLSLKEKILILLAINFIAGLIYKGSAYISTSIDPDYIPMDKMPRGEVSFFNANTVENIILLPSSAFLAYQFIIISLSILGDLLKNMKRR